MINPGDPTPSVPRAVVEAWAAAELAGDASALDRLLASDFVGVGPLGFALTKADRLERHASGDPRDDAFAWNEPQVRLYGEAAVVIGRQTASATYLGRPIPAGTLRTTHILIRQGGDWRLAGVHMSPIGPPPA